MVEYFYVETPNTPGVGAAMLATLRDAGVNLLVFSGFPSGRRAQIDFVPENAATFRAAAVATSQDTAWASLLLIVYAIGAALPMLAIAYGGQAVTTRVRSIARIAPRLQQGFGIVVIAFALLSYLQYDTLIVAWLTGFYPNGQIGL